MRPTPEQIAELAHRAGIDNVGFASAAPFESTRADIERRRAAGLHGGMAFTYRDPARSTDPGRALPGARSLVVAARSYRRADVERPAGPYGPIARYSWQDHYAPLRAALDQVAELLRGNGWRARTLVDDNALVDRAAAHRAGFGWYGKNTLLLLPRRGSWFVLGSVVTDAPLPTREEPVPDGCGTCTRCMSACPTGALSEPGVLDASRCLAWLLEAPGAFPIEHRAALGGRIYGCDECQTVCPPNRRADRADPPPPPEGGEEPFVDLVALLCADDADILDRYGRWYIPRRDPRYVRRNALVALGNVGDGADPRTISALSRSLAAPDPVVRSHAVWAATRLGRTDLVEAAVASWRAAGDDAGALDAMVVEELHRAGITA
ncbi:MAG TPA: tRNA epoxyqueuosine(34) reductase QueG [Acidimicrobiales bacterium]|nr:tRNA epoxyqueuosine(34) reductase QueG [Acidimicrobiales bacterium]